MRIDSSGNVGIGVTNPNTKLHVGGIIQVTESSNTAFYGGNYVRLFSDQNYGFRNSGGTYIANISMSGNSYFNGGNVGIGTTNPGTKLQVGENTSGLTGTTSIFQEGGAEVGLYVKARVNRASILVADNDTGVYISAEGGKGSFGRTQGVSPANINIDGSGNVGIGTTAPSKKLHLSSTSNNGSDILQQTDGSRVILLEQKNGSIHWQLGTFGSTGGGANNRYSIKNATTGVEAFVIHPTNNNVGIGNTSPANKLDVVGLAKFTHSSSTGYRGAIETVTANAYPTWDIGWLHARSSSSNYGNVARFNDQNGSQIGAITYSGSTSVSYSTTSDYRLKENIKEISDSISRVKKLKPCRFNFTTEKDRIVDGFIAHEVQEVVPEAVHGEKDALQEDGSIDTQTLEVSRLVPVLTKALQEAIDKIEKLELRIQTIENN